MRSQGRRLGRSREIAKERDRGLQVKGEETFKEEMINSSLWGRMSDKVW